jgi:hypothetical protein
MILHAGGFSFELEVVGRLRADQAEFAPVLVQRLKSEKYRKQLILLTENVPFSYTA